MTKNYTTRTLLIVLEDMGYEIDMLCGMHLLRSKPFRVAVENIDSGRATEWISNALLEAQCIHVRTLLEFFYVGEDRIRASHYVADWNTKHRPDAKTALGEDAGSLYGDISGKLSHLNSPRTEKRVWDALPTITEGLLHTARKFDTLLDADGSSALRSKAPDIGWTEVTGN